MTEIWDSQALAGRTAIVAGGARGIGEAVSRTLHAIGAQVVIADLLEAEGEALAASLGERAKFARLDVTDQADWASVTSVAEAWSGNFEILANCAGIAITHAITEFPESDFRKVLDVNLVGAFLGIKEAAPVMRSRGRGSIINFASIDGTQAGNSMAAYSASKWGLRGLSKVAAMELGPFGVRVNTICPGPVNTPMLNPKGEPIADIERRHPYMARMPLQRIGDPMELANACAFLASDAASFVTGTDLMVDGGTTIGNYYPHRPGGLAR